ncbi:uncharacterized protein EDB91DRAFT_1200347 [Suillus paluster]|uniref:uncharacterized protein n=1 Tax=Suillus paluster TaxID=48578 RepID=UPI001B8699CF|nr:uncharacterized protein EDB91DRAFT_1200347 [Suillus paluster]KAG1744018.1 hypothetical protein EDB91DRAFT_1200347 [Suillus paluster]
MASVVPSILNLITALGPMTCDFISVQKGPHQTTICSAIMLTLASCYPMWMTAYVAQLHPLIAPYRFPKVGESLSV